MAFYYMDTDTGDDADNGTTWALAKLTLEGLHSVMSAGDTGFVQGAADDTAAVSRTFTSSGTRTNPCRVIGVADGTTNTGTSVVASDLASTLPKVSCTGATSDLTFAENIIYVNIHFTTGDVISWTGGDDCIQEFNGCKITMDGQCNCNGTRVNLVNCELEPITTIGELFPASAGKITVYGGSYTFTAAADLVRNFGGGFIDMYGVDLSGLTGSIQSGGNSNTHVRLTNCKMPASPSLFASTTTAGSVELIASNNTTSQGATTSIQDYEYEDSFGTISLETTIVRTGGADDGATGAFAYAMTPHANTVLESTGANLASPWMSVWVAGGATTLTVYICNDAASDAANDYHEDEVWCEFMTPSSTDLAQHDQTFDPADERLLDSTTSVTDDTGSTWGSGGNNHQKFSASVTTGFEGWAYARVHLAKRSATPDTLYLDPKIAVT